MAENKVRRENHITIQGWMLTDLKLKGNELIVYACIYGFSQAENQIFNGSLQYLADWTNSTKQGVVKCLKSLIEKGYIVKEEKYFNSIKFCEYYATKFNGVLNKVEQGIKQSLPNNITNNKDDNIVEDIVAYLNEKAGTSYRSNSKTTQKHINARLNEGYTLDDFKVVIDKKVDEWKGTEMEKYLRPETLFGTKFESYLNAKVNKPQSNKKKAIIGGTDIERRAYSDDMLNNLFTALDEEDE